LRGALGVALGFLAVTGLAQGEERARLVYVRRAGAESCPSEVDLRLWVMARLGYDPFSPQASRVVVAHVEIDGQTLGGRVELVDEQGVSSGLRTMTSSPDRCEELVRAMALSISLAIDPERAGQPPHGEGAVPARTEEPAVTPSPKKTDPPPSARPLAAAPSSRLSAGVAFAAGLGILPGVALGGFGSVGYHEDAWSLGLEVGALWSLGQGLPGGGRLGGALFGPKLLVCGDVVSRISVCAVGMAAAQRLGSSGVAEPATSTGAFVGVGPRLALRIPFSAGLGLTVAAEGLLDLTRNTARFSNQSVWSAPWVSGQALIGVDSHLP